MGFPEAKWAVDQVVGKLAVPPDDMRAFSATSIGATKVGLKFLEPEDAVYSPGGAKANIIAGVMIRMSTEGYPLTENEGTLVLDNTDLGRYENTYFEVDNLTEGETYYFTAFPYTSAGIYNTSPKAANRASAIPLPGETVAVTVQIDDIQEFTPAVLTLHNLTDNVTETKTVSAPGTFNFTIEQYKQYKVSITNVNKYVLDKTETSVYNSQPGGLRQLSFSYTYQAHEIINVTAVIDDDSEFSSAVVTLTNSTDGTTEEKTVTPANKTVQFSVPPGKSCKISIAQVPKYSINQTETNSFVTVLGNTRNISFNYIYLAPETVNVNVTVDDTQEFSSTEITLHNITDGTSTSQTLYGAGQVTFYAEQSKVFKVSVTKVDKYSLNMQETAQFTAVLGNTREFTFAYTYAPGWHLTIEVDNGADGIPASFEYKDDCAGFTPASGSNMNSWAGHEILDYFKPCVIKPGAALPEYYLYKDNYTKKADGVTDSVLTGSDGDVMIEVDRLYYKVYPVNANRFGLTITNIPGEEGYQAFNDVAGVDVEKRYRGAYEAYNSGGQMRSISGVTPTVNQTRAVFRGQAQARGAEYSQNDYSLLLLWECMYLLLYGSRHSQGALGAGRTNSSNSACVATGTLNARPFCWGDEGGVNGVKFLGVEHFYGDLWEFVDGLTMSGLNAYITRDPAKYNDATTGYEKGPFALPSTSGKYVKKVHGNVVDAMFLPKEVEGSESTFWCDMEWTNSSAVVARFGGCWNRAGQAGAFCWDLDSAASGSSSAVGSRLCRKKVS